ncbi:hypothetical protein PsYK624_118890 [Phanerochaete sordida]|uniref:F-box domain-containing protein n=1 Tax=Phanerochaete sordida TaxID=48140 RepID=A0A9P3GGS0_9APHY|nr:hypothetical protein PsYK624_118890 [Phanerochaete sordida]
MDTLWQKPRDVKYLVNLLPRSCFMWVGMNGEYVELLLKSRPSEADWARFSTYARRVRTLDVHCYAKGGDLPIHWCSILRSFPGNQPLPRLRSMHWEWSPDYGCLHSALLVRPPLQRLHFGAMDVRGLKQIIEVLPSCASTLEHLRIGKRFRSASEPELAERLWQTLTKLQRLVGLDVSLYVPQAFCHLASLSNITSLHLLLDSADTEDTIAPFPALKSLELSVNTHMDAPAKLLRRMVLPTLEHLNIIDDFLPRAAIPMPRANAAHVRLTLQEVAKVTSLRSFMFKCHGHTSTAPTEALDASALSPLHDLRELETLDVGALAVSMVAADVEPMARAWPRMQNLQLYQRHAIFGTDLPCVLEVADILPFADLCPHLRELGLLVHIGPPAAPLDDDSELPAHAALKTLRAAISLPPFTPALRILARTFPAAELKGYGYAPDRDEAVNEAKKALVHELYGTQFENTDG